MIDYQAVLNIINTSDNPAYALEIFVAQEKEAAAHEATQAIKRKDHEASQRRGYPWD